MDPDPADSFAATWGGLSLLLESDAVMEALGQIEIEPGESKVTYAEILTGTAKSFADLKAAVEKWQEGGA